MKSVRSVGALLVRLIMPARWAAAACGSALCILAVEAHAGDLLNVGAIAVGQSFVCALLGSGGVKCWGRDERGELGDGSNTVSRETPADVLGLTAGVKAIAAGGQHTCALMTAGGVKCWGGNELGQLGDGSTVDRNVPVDVVGLGPEVVALSAGDAHTCALTATGGVKCWGRNFNGQLGDGTLTERLVPTDVPSLSTGIAAVSAGGNRTCALTQGGGVKCWGLSIGNVATDVAGLSSGVVRIAAGSGSVACAVTNAPGLKCWGVNEVGQIGDGTLQPRSSPVDVVGSADMSGVAPGSFHTCGLTAGGAVKCWGGNVLGQLGQGYAGGEQLTPSPALGVAAGVAAISSYSGVTCAVMTSGIAKCWGDNSSLQLTSATLGAGVPSTIGVPGSSSQTVTLAGIPNHDLNDAPFGVTASSSSGLPVTVESLTPAVCTVSGTTVTLVSIGMCSITARQPGGPSLSAAEVIQTFRVSGATATMAPRLANISTRANVGSGTAALIGGFIVTGFEPKLVAIIATGPSLSTAGISNPLADPAISLVRLPDGQVMDVNNDWGTSPAAATLQTMGLAPSDPHDAAILARLAPGAYTAVVSGVGGATGVSVVGIYEIDRPETPLINISSRAQVLTGNDVMI
ncbi:MAG TPA: hypothetical protein VN903_14500, partial [Polyangia bacterium]|nr:hypothetical protein [Polyangia bacterium]